MRAEMGSPLAFEDQPNLEGLLCNHHMLQTNEHCSLYALLINHWCLQFFFFFISVFPFFVRKSHESSLAILTVWSFRHWEFWRQVLPQLALPQCWGSAGKASAVGRNRELGSRPGGGYQPSCWEGTSLSLFHFSFLQNLNVTWLCAVLTRRYTSVLGAAPGWSAVSGPGVSLPTWNCRGCNSWLVSCSPPGLTGRWRRSWTRRWTTNYMGWDQNMGSKFGWTSLCDMRFTSDWHSALMLTHLCCLFCSFFAQIPVVNDDLPARVISGRVLLKPNVKEFRRSSVVFVDGSIVDKVQCSSIDKENGHKEDSLRACLDCKPKSNLQPIQFETGWLFCRLNSHKSHETRFLAKPIANR